MNGTQRIISVGFASAAILAASAPALSFGVFTDIEIDPRTARASLVRTGAQADHVWVPGHHVQTASGRQWIEGKWVADGPQRARASIPPRR